MRRDVRAVFTYTADWCVGYARIMWDILGYSGIFWDIWSLMFFQKDPPQTEGRRDADLLIKTSPDSTDVLYAIWTRDGSVSQLRC